jgi:hypothetical protein
MLPAVAANSVCNVFQTVVGMALNVADIHISRLFSLDAG